MANKREPSDMFNVAVRHSGTLVIDCEFCGRTHFATGKEGWYDDGELEDLKNKQQEQPDKYIEDTEYDDITWGTLDGKQWVWGCQCNSARKYEDLFWNHRYIIAEYFEERAKKELKEKEMQMKKIDGIKENVK